jgi:putative aldouronate transport system substrate-binding protein
LVPLKVKAFRKYILWRNEMKNTLKSLLAVFIAMFFTATLWAGGKAETGVRTTPGKPRISAAIYDRGNIPASEGSITDNRWTKWINENAPVELEFIAIPRNSSGEKYNTLFASGTAPDFIEEFGVANLNTFIANKLLMPLNDTIEKYSLEYKQILTDYPALRDFLTQPDGMMHTFGVIYPAASNHYFVVRTDWLKKLNLEIPKTMDDLVKTAQAFTYNDPDGNGKNDTYGLSLAAGTGGVINAMFGGMTNWQWDWEFSRQGAVYRWEWAEAMVNFKKTLYDLGCVDKDYATDSNGTKANQDFQTGRLGIYGMNGGKNSTLGALQTLKGTIPDADFAAIPLPQTIAGRWSPAGGNFLQMNAAINSRSKDPGAVMAYVDWLNRKDTIISLRYGGETYSQLDPALGGLIPKDQEKFKTEVSYNSDFHMTASKILDPYNDILPYNLSDPIQKRAQDIVVAADKIYLDPGIRHKQLISFPSIPQELALIQANIGTQIDDIYTKCILGGSSYSVDQAMRDAKRVFTASGGEKLTAYYDAFFKANPKQILDDSSLKDVLPAYIK